MRNPLCDLCVGEGNLDSRMLGPEKLDEPYVCSRHVHRSYHPSRGYVSHHHFDPEYAPACHTPDCTDVSFIERARSAEDFTLRCPRERLSPGSIPVR